MDLDRFLVAQRDVFDRALTELRAGAKRSHWMWFVFPQVAGLGHSDVARRFAIADRAHALAYLTHPILGHRLLHAVEALLEAEGTAMGILGPVDAMKLRSSMTLFEAVADDAAPFARVLDRFFGGTRDEATLARLA